MKHIIKYACFIAILFIVTVGMTGCLEADALSTQEIVPQSSGTELKVHYIDVGQGDSQLIQKDGINTLIDTGESSESESLISYLKQQGVTKIDNFIITHPHTDHMGGAAQVIESLDIGNVYMTNYVHTTNAYEDLLKTIKKKGVKLIQAKAGISVDLGKGIKGDIISPLKDYEDINASSIILKATYNKNSFLFTGDATKETENDLLEKGVDLKSDVYKVAHHGSDYSNGLDYLKQINPSLSIIEVGADNSYGHPHTYTMKYLNQLKSTILRTDLQGTIVVTSDGMNLSYKTAKKSSPSSIDKKPATNDKTTAESPAAKPNSTKEKIQFIGNKNSKIYHKTSCSSLPISKNSIDFSSKKAASSAGYKPCQRCNP